MVVITIIGYREQSLIKPALINPALITRYQQNRLPQWIKGKSNPPDLTISREPKFFHVRVLKALQRIDRWSAEMGPKLSQQFGMRQQFILNVIFQSLELFVKGIVKDNGPCHG
jgi:hypothetical protein